MKDSELKDIEITFSPRKCPVCRDLLSIRELGVWGYYCDKCMRWLGLYDNYPELKPKNR